MSGVPSRAAMLRSFGTSLLNFPSVFGEQGRSGNIVGVCFNLLCCQALSRRVAHSESHLQPSSPRSPRERGDAYAVRS